MRTHTVTWNGSVSRSSANDKLFTEFYHLTGGAKHLLFEREMRKHENRVACLRKTQEATCECYRLQYFIYFNNILFSLYRSSLQIPAANLTIKQLNICMSTLEHFGARDSKCQSYFSHALQCAPSTLYARV